MTTARFTLVGGPTVLVEAAGWTLLVDPTFDPPGRTYRFGFGTSSRKTTGPALEVRDLPPVDVVLLTHDQHADNLDGRGRELLRTASTVVTTADGARRLRGDLGPRVQGLADWRTTVLTRPGRPELRVTATPARHGPPGSRPLVGQVVGFAVAWPGQEHGALWFSGDTVLHRGLREVARRIDVGTAVLHLGGVRFPVTGPVRLTMTARDAVRVGALHDARTVLPVHVEGWTHFREPRAAAEAVFAGAPAAFRAALRWLERGTPTEVEV